MAGLGLIASGAPAGAGASEARVTVGDYVHVSDDGGETAPLVDSNVAVTVTVGDSGYNVTPR